MGHGHYVEKFNETGFSFIGSSNQQVDTPYKGMENWELSILNDVGKSKSRKSGESESDGEDDGDGDGNREDYVVKIKGRTPSVPSFEADGSLE